MSKVKIIDLLNKQQGYITTKDLLTANIARQYLSIMVKVGLIVRVSVGVYRRVDAWDDDLFVTQHRKQHMVYSHETALFLHGLSDRDPIHKCMTFPTGTHVNSLTPNQDKLFFIAHPLLDLGKTRIMSSLGHPLIVYDQERTLCDMIRSRHRVDVSLLYGALKVYVKHPHKDLNRLHMYAKKLKVERLLYSYLSVLMAT